MYLIAFPLLLVPFALYNMVAFLLDLSFDTALFGFSLLSGQRVAVSAGDVLVILGVLLLYVEILKVTRLAAKAVMDHLLSVMLFVPSTAAAHTPVPSLRMAASPNDPAPPPFPAGRPDHNGRGSGHGCWPAGFRPPG